MLVGYLGPKGSFTHDVATHSFPTSERIAYRTITDVIKAYENQEIDFAVVPVENSIEGSVHETLDYLFHQGTIQAVAEVVYPIKQQLLVAKKDRPIRTVYSHPQALAQGKAFLRAHYPDAAMEMTASTAYAARYVAEHPELEIAAIALWQQPVSTVWKSRPKISKKSRTTTHVLGFRDKRALDFQKL